jgi:AbrB family looped-hinge helix DNA binding protein
MYPSLMAIARSRLTAQGQISVPAEIRRRLGLAPGSVIDWEEDQGEIVVRRGGDATWEDIHQALFAGEPAPKARTAEEMGAGIRRHIRKKHGARR